MGLLTSITEGFSAFAKAWDDEPSAVDLSKAKGGGPMFSADGVPADLEGMFQDPYNWYGIEGEYYEKPTTTSWGVLQSMSMSPILAAVIGRRVADVGQFGRVQRSPTQAGFYVGLRDRDANPTRVQKKACREMETFVAQTGVVSDYRETLTRDNFTTFLKKIARDAVTYDQGCFQVVNNHYGKPASFYAMPGASMRLARHDTGLDPRDWEAIRYVQIIQDQVVAQWGGSEFCLGVRNPRTDLNIHGYGFSEVEQVTRVLAGWLFGFEHNNKYFMQGANIKGILNLKGTISQKMLRRFQREFRNLVSGVNNAHRVPVTSADAMEWISLGETNKDMEFNQWMDFLTKLVCAIFQMDPAEINFTFGNTGQGGAMGGEDSVDKATHSKDQGLRPLVEAIFDWVNRFVIWPINPDLELIPAGLTAKSTDEIRTLQEKESKFLKTVDELRAEEDMEPLPDGKGAVILNPTWLQFAQQVEGDGADDEPAEMDTGDLFDPGPEQDQNPDEDGDDPDLIDDDQQPDEDLRRSWAVQL